MHRNAMAPPGEVPPHESGLDVVPAEPWVLPCHHHPAWPPCRQEVPWPPTMPSADATWHATRSDPRFGAPWNLQDLWISNQLIQAVDVSWIQSLHITSFQWISVDSISKSQHRNQTGKHHTSHAQWPNFTRVWSKENASSQTIHRMAPPSGKGSSTTFEHTWTRFVDTNSNDCTCAERGPQKYHILSVTNTSTGPCIHSRQK